MKVACKTPLLPADLIYNQKIIEIGYNKDTMFHVTEGRVYTVYSVIMWNSETNFLIEDDNNCPGWYPHFLFTLVSRKIPREWEFGCEYPVGSDLQFIMGYPSRVTNSSHYDWLAGEKDADVAIFKKNKYLSDCDE